MSAAGAALRVWRIAKPMTQSELCAELAARTGERKPGGGLVSRWESGTQAPGPAYLDALESLGAPVDTWRTPAERAARSAAHGKLAAAYRADTGAELDEGDAATSAQVTTIAAMLDSGAPILDVYATAARVLASSLTAGLSPDQGRAWTALMRLMREAVAAIGEAPLAAHPDFKPWLDDMLARVGAANPAALDAIVQALE